MATTKSSAPPPKQISFLGNLIGGTFAGIGICLVGHPFGTAELTASASACGLQRGLDVL